LLLQAAGFSHEEIDQGRRWTQTKVKRCIYEGRVALRQTRWASQWRMAA
jgi:hypothetical protein